MAMTVVKNSEKLIVWLHRTKKTQQWLAAELNITRQSVNKKINNNSFTESDMAKLKQLGFVE